MIASPWGPLAVEDAHIHLFSHRFFSLLTQAAPEETAARLEWDAPPADPAALADRWAAELDLHGVSRAALIASLPGDEDSVLRAVAHRPDRFYAYAMVNPTSANGIARASEALAKGVTTLCLFPAMHHYSVADPALAPFWEMAAAARANAFVHCGVLSVGVRKRLGLPSAFDMRYSNPLDLQVVASRHPVIRFIIPHFGAGMFREALMVADHCPNIWLDTASSNSWMKYHAPGLTLEAVFRQALAVLGPARLLFGTDSSFFPRGWVRGVLDDQIAALARLDIAPAAAAAIFGGNLARFHARA